MEATFEILRTRTVTIDERVEYTVDVPGSVPEDGREDWVIDQIEKGEIEVPDSAWEVSDESESADYQEVTQL